MRIKISSVSAFPGRVIFIFSARRAQKCVNPAAQKQNHAAYESRGTVLSHTLSLHCCLYIVVFALFAILAGLVAYRAARLTS